MANIKVKDVAQKGIKTLNKAAIQTERFKDTIVRTKEKAEESVSDDINSVEYASNKIKDNVSECIAILKHATAFILTPKIIANIFTNNAKIITSSITYVSSIINAIINTANAKLTPKDTIFMLLI